MIDDEMKCMKCLPMTIKSTCFVQSIIDGGTPSFNYHKAFNFNFTKSFVL